MISEHFMVRPLESGDIDRMFPLLRKNDMMEIKGLYPCAKNSKELINCIKSGCEYAHVYVCVSGYSGLPFCIFGCSEHSYKDSRQIFMFGTDELILLFKRDFVKYAKEWLKYLSKTYKFKVGVNIVHEKNEVHIKWLKHLGAEFEFNNPIYPEYSKEKFIPFKLNLL